MINTEIAVNGHEERGAGNRVPGDVVNNATKDLPENQRNAIRSLHDFYMRNDLSLAEVSKLIGMSESVAGLLFRNKYTAGLESVIVKVEQFLKLQSARQHTRKLDFIETGLSKDIFGISNTTWTYQRIGFSYGEPQIGKTTALEAFADKNRGAVIYERMPNGGAQSNFMIALAKRLHICASLAMSVLRQRIFDAFDNKMLLIVDEMNECTPLNSPGYKGVNTINFIREIHDRKKCGVLMAGTNVFRDKLENGPFSADFLQLQRRGVLTLQLPDRPSQEDLDIFSQAYGLPPSRNEGDAAKLEANVIQADALGMWLNLLRIASDLAAKSEESMRWHHVLIAHAGQKKLAGKKF